MSPILTAGVSIVNLALIFYTISTVILIRKKTISKTYLSFLTFGVIFDITATICMIIAAPNKGITLHGLVGYSALIAMVADLIFCYRYSNKYGNKQLVSKSLKNVSVIIYVYWLLAYITGAIIVMLR